MKNTKFIKIILYSFFPIFITLITEYNHMQNFNVLLEFITSNFTVFIYGVVLTSIIFLSLLFFIKKSHIAVMIQSIILYILSTVEYFKYTTSGTHLTLSDLAMTQNISDIGKFASLDITWPLVIDLVLILLYIKLCSMYKLNLNFSLKKRLITSFIFVGILLASILLPAPSTNIYATFKIDNEDSTNIFDINNSFDNNGLIGFLSQTTTQKFSSILHKPENYSEEFIESNLSTEKEVSEVYDKPNVIFIMSESFGDFRNLDSSKDLSSYYESYDSIASENFLGNCVVPTFGGYTTRTEFELLFGLPVYSLNTPTIPHKIINVENDIDSIPSYFKSLGYTTTYIHPFSGSFYSRNSAYPDFGFDNLYFEDDMTDATRFRRYIDDSSVFEKIKVQLQEDKTSSYIFTTTMQNHQPYYDETSNLTELEYYLEGTKKTGDDLKSFLSWLDDFEEDVILVFVGDHYPFFTPSSNVYNEFGINNDNTEKLYEQKYLIYNNYNKDFSYLSDKNISTFYLPYVVIDSLDTPVDSFITTMINHMDTTSIYSPNIQSIDGRDEILDNLTYDRVEGENYSK